MDVGGERASVSSEGVGMSSLPHHPFPTRAFRSSRRKRSCIYPYHFPPFMSHFVRHLRAGSGSLGGTSNDPRCPWNWKVCEAVCAVGAALAASEDWGEQESADLWRHAAKEYKARANAMSAAGKWPVNGSADHPVLAESIKWRCETKPNGKVIWDRWLEIKREVGSVLLPLLKNQLAKQQPKGEEGGEQSTNLYSGTNWEEVTEQVRVEYYKKKSKSKSPGQPPKGWNTPAFAAFIEYGPPAIANGGACIAAFQLTACARKRGQHNPALGRNSVRRTAKKLKSEEAREDGMQHENGNGKSPVSGMIPQSPKAISPISKQIVEELRGVRASVDAFNHRQNILAALPFVTDAAQKEELVAQLINSATPKSIQPCSSMSNKTSGNPATPCEGSIDDM